MVSRSRLALILLLACGWISCLLAQPLFLPTAPPLELPAGQDFGVLPPRALLKIAIFPDSSYVLLEVIPASLKPHAEAHLRQMDLLSYLAEGGSTGVRELEITLKQSEAGADSVPEPEIRALIDELIIKQRELDSPGAVWRDWLDPLAAEDLNYKTATNVSGLHIGSDALMLHGLDLPGSPVEKIQRLGWLRGSFDGADAYDHFSSKYPFEILLTGLNAGMGEYDSRYAKIKAGRNGLFGTPGLYYGLDLTVANGSWLGLNSAQTNTRHLLSVPLGRVGLDLEYASFAQDFASITLQPAFWKSPLFLYERSGEMVWSRFSSPWLDLAFSRSREALSSTVFAFRPQSLMYQAQAGKTLKMGNLQVGARWVHAWREGDLLLPRESYQSEYKDKGSLALQYDGKQLLAKAEASLSDLKDAVTEASLAYRMGSFKAGLGFKTDLSDFDPRVSVTDLYNLGANLDNVDLRERRKLWLQLDWQPGDLSIALSAGRKDYSMALPENGVTTVYEAAPFFVGLGTVYDIDLRALKLILRQNLLWTQEQDNMRNDPAFRGFGELELRRGLSHDNAIYATLGYVFHSSYLNLARQPDILDFSLIADARLGVRISKLFEIDAGIRNLGDNFIFGVYPIPFSLHASVRWYFVN